MIDLYLDPSTHDLPAPRSLRILRDPDDRGEIMVQRVRVLLKTLEGEYSYDTSFGIPYLQSFMGRGVKSATVAGILRAKILELDGALSVPRCDVVLDLQTRKLTGTIEITYEGGTATVEV